MPQKKETEDYAKKRAAYLYRRRGTKAEEAARDKEIEDAERAGAERSDRMQEHLKQRVKDEGMSTITPMKMRKAGGMDTKKADKVAMYQRKAVNEANPDTDWSDSGQRKRWGAEDYGKKVAKKKK